MTDRTPTPEMLERTADALGDLVLSTDGLVTPAEDEAARRRFLAEVHRPSQQPWWAYAAAAAVVGSLAAGVYTVRGGGPAPADPAMTYTASPALASVGSTIMNPSSGTGLIVFSDGSDLTLHSETQLRITDIDADGAVVELTEGHLFADIDHDRDTAWRLDAGDFAVHVVGTVFEVDWEPHTGLFEVVLHEGRVEVEVPWMRAPVGLEQAQRLLADAHDQTVYVGPIDDMIPAAGGADRPSGAEDAADTEVAQVAVPTSLPVEATGIETNPPVEDPTDGLSEGDERPTVEPDPTPSAEREEADPVEHEVTAVDVAADAGESAPDETWRGLVAEGNFEGVVAAAQENPDLLEDADLDDLVALSEAARYTRNLDLARSALIEVRGRYGASNDARQAAFFLGRLEERERHLGEAVTWYETYLEESPSSRYADQALGRLMLVLSERGDDDAAAERAAEYLGAYPEGTYAPAAGALVQP